MLPAIQSARLKLSEYYAMTDEIHSRATYMQLLQSRRHKTSSCLFPQRTGSQSGVYDTARALRSTLHPISSAIRNCSYPERPILATPYIVKSMLVCESPTMTIFWNTEWPISSSHQVKPYRLCYEDFLCRNFLIVLVVASKHSGNIHTTALGFRN